MRADVCLHRSAALIAAAEDAGVAEPGQATVGSGGRAGMLPTPLAALFAQASSAHTELTYERIRFDPVPVYVGPAPGWKGPALGARRTATGTAAAPAAASTIANTQGDAGAPTQPSSRSKLKRDMPKKGWRRTNLSTARPKNWRRRTYLPTECEIARGERKLATKSFQLSLIILVRLDYQLLMKDTQFFYNMP